VKLLSTLSYYTNQKSTKTHPPYDRLEIKDIWHFSITMAKELSLQSILWMIDYLIDNVIMIYLILACKLFNNLIIIICY